MDEKRAALYLHKIVDVENNLIGQEVETLENTTKSVTPQLRHFVIKKREKLRE
jgi:hypothetical protein